MQKAAVWDKFLLFGDSITQDSFNQQRGFSFSAGLQHGTFQFENALFASDASSSQSTYDDWM